MNARIQLAMKWAAVAALVTTRFAWAQTSGTATALPGRPDAASIAASFDSALSAAKTGDLVSAQATLVASNLHRTNTLEWDIESSTKLLHLALTLRERLDYTHAQQLAQQVISQLSASLNAHGPVTTAAHRAQAYEMIGLVYETVLADTAAAKAAYQQAQGLNSSSLAASAGLARIQGVEAAKLRALGGH